MPFFGDVGWFYLSARDIFLTGNIPLVGITSSHTWLHQGPLWTYILSVIFLFSFNPVYPAYLTALFGVVTVWLLYKLGTDLFSKKVGLISAAFYATSPLIIIHSRTPYHTSLIPFFTVFLIWATYKWILGNTKFFPLVILLLLILYNFELATAVFWFIIIAIVFYGLYKNKSWTKEILRKDILFFSLIAFILPMLPILIYDFEHGFPQTAKFTAWVVYRIITKTIGSLQDMILFFEVFSSRLLYLSEKLPAMLIVLLSFFFLMYRVFIGLKERKLQLTYVLLFLYTIVPLGALLVNKTPSEAYLPMLFPQIILTVGLFFSKLMLNSIFKVTIVLVIVFLIIINSYSLIREEYLMGESIGYGPTFKDRLEISKKIINDSNKKEYNLTGKEMGSQFESFTMNYEYLLWYLGKAPSKRSEERIFTVVEEKGRIYLK